MKDFANLNVGSKEICAFSFSLLDSEELLPSLSLISHGRLTNKRLRAVSKSLDPGTPGRPMLVELELYST